MPETPAELDAIITDIRLTGDDLHEKASAMQIRAGIDPDAPEPTEEQRRANLEALRADNDAKLAVIRRRKT